ncbi:MULTISPECIES: hypothetical protein [Mesorhizobium]|uniref:hypothetical protein n=1 Tax=Mesorhizobium TaxID=68287 RepID=UPI0007A94BD5|nr:MULTISPECIES: hypothetical protein [Mesorhizobium]AMX93608.1 hypothetical protein A4R28_11125 [Mesorhizobium ciceri]MDF3208300.1 hypothetical protein [Mesorhizobium sp. LMG15046]MDF3229128.1 hypothetical protein [Mesorhizobium sp. DSM 30133]RUU22236.1 hypothetical protein EOC84_03755 [Mesorhizobium sp. Primo-B]RUU37855.1 hypothetical protein EOC83_16460 [Mesorhizobium sp. Primo-A]
MGVLLNPFVLATGDGPPPTPDVNVWTLDFINEVYTKNGSPVVLADIIDKPARVGASGLEILDNDVAGGVFAAGDFLTDLITMSWTNVIEWEELAGVDYTELLYIWESGNHHHFGIDNTGAGTIDTYDTGSTIREIFDTGAYLAGVHKVAVTRTDSLLSVSTDGNAVVTDASVQSLDLQEIATFGGPNDGSSYKGFFIRSIALMPPVADAALPGLSA